jgi:hypothetical protein
VLFWPLTELIGTGSTAGNRRAIAMQRSRNSHQGSTAANRMKT